MWVKICGIRDVRTAMVAVSAGADAVGLNLVRQSPRFVSPEVARAIAERLEDLQDLRATVGGDRIEDMSGADVRRSADRHEAVRVAARGRTTPVLLVVNEPLKSLRALLSEIPVCWVQLHGDESPRYVAEVRALVEEVRGRPATVIKAVRPEGAAGWRTAAEFAEASGSERPDALLLDAAVPGRYGGTGRRLDWDRVAANYRRDRWPPLILAGGLTPENVRDAISIVRPFGVDTASGVEWTPGRKDPDRLRWFVETAKRVSGPPSC
ncbi:MAG: phosphoribosylanthranilate isomerase [Planctomycetota bacterium]|nr:MAG: phosphoribosylanthranilate isomerase [Planctomycetota bacterium]